MNNFNIIFLIFLISLGTVTGQTIDKEKINTPGYFDSNVRNLFKLEKWEEGKKILDNGLRLYPYLTSLNELAGKYYYEYKEYDIARYHLILALRDDNENVQAKQLLVNVEEETGNYSSAICYVNELLEITPYSKGLWRRKIELYRKQNNHIEADRLLRRIIQVYPNDSVLMNDLYYQLDLSYRAQQKSGNRNAAINSLEELVKSGSATEEYYLSLVNLYIQQGDYESALRIASLGEMQIPRSEDLTIKKASILAETQQYDRAIAFIKEKSRQGGGRISSLYNNLMLEEARSSNDKEPYILHGKLYEITKSKESLDYLINTAVLRGYNEDALHYIAIAKKRERPTAGLLYKEYQVNKRMGNLSRATQLLESIQELQPNDADIIYELSGLKLKQASAYMNEDNIYEAIALLNYIVQKCEDKEMQISALEKLYSCYIQKRQYPQALDMLNELSRITYSVSLLEKRAYVYSKQGSSIEGLKLLEDTLMATQDEVYKDRLISAYEEIAIPYIKTLIEDGAWYDALQASENFLRIKPSSFEALQYSINVAASLGREEDFEKYVAQALVYYPTNAFFIVKQSSIFNSKDEPFNAVALLTPTLDRLPGSLMVVNAFSESCEKQALLLLKENKTQEALEITNEALAYDKANRSLLYTKGVIYAKLNQFDSAYHYQKAYNPSFMEALSFNRHLNGLIAKSKKNEIGLDYLQARYGEQDIITSIAMVHYTRKNLKNSYTGRLFFAGRDGYDIENKEVPMPGGSTLQIQGEWIHIFNSKWEMMLGGGLGGRYFPSMMLYAKAQHNFKRELSIDLHLGFRTVSNYQKRFEWNLEMLNEETETMGFWEFVGWDQKKISLLNVGVGFSKSIEQLTLTGKLDAFHLSSNLYFSMQAQAKYFFLNDAHSYLLAFAGIGTAPEASVIDYAMPNSFEKISTTVGCGGNYLISSNLALGVTGYWNTFYDKKIRYRGGDQLNFVDNFETIYKNLYNIELHAIIYF